jgi:hypothetical protein
MPGLVNSEINVHYIKLLRKCKPCVLSFCGRSHVVGGARNLKTGKFCVAISRRRSRFLECKTLYQHRNYESLVEKSAKHVSESASTVIKQ